MWDAGIPRAAYRQLQIPRGRECPGRILRLPRRNGVQSRMKGQALHAPISEKIRSGQPLKSTTDRTRFISGDVIRNVQFCLVFRLRNSSTHVYMPAAPQISDQLCQIDGLCRDSPDLTLSQAASSSSRLASSSDRPEFDIINSTASNLRTNFVFADRSADSGSIPR